MKLIDSKPVRVLLLALLLSGFCSTVVVGQKADNEYQAGGVLWMQTSGERAALCYQAFTVARMVLDRDLRGNHTRRKRAVVVDVDETIMDNSRYQAWQVKNRQGFSDQTWLEWVNRAEATAIPGAGEIPQYSHPRGGGGGII